MKTGPIASYLVVDPRGIWRGGKHLPPGDSFGARPGVHVRRWLAAGRIAVMPGKRTTLSRRVNRAQKPAGARSNDSPCRSSCARPAQPK